MFKRYLLALVFLIAVINLYLTSTNMRTNNYISDLIEQVSLERPLPHGPLIPVNPPMVKTDRKDREQYDIMALYRDLHDDLICRVFILPDGIVEEKGKSVRLSLLTFNVSAMEEKFIEKNGHIELPKKMNNHKLMKPCKGEVVLELLEDVGFTVHNLTHIEQTGDNFKYHELGYCTKEQDMSDRYLEIDGKSSVDQKFKFEFQLFVMGLIYPEKYADKSTFQTVTGWKYFMHIMIIICFAFLLLAGNYWYNRRIRGLIFQKIDNDIELQNIGSVDHDLDQFMIDDEDDEDMEAGTGQEQLIQDDQLLREDSTESAKKKKNKKVSFKNVDENEVKNLLNNSE